MHCKRIRCLTSLSILTLIQTDYFERLASTFIPTNRNYGGQAAGKISFAHKKCFFKIGRLAQLVRALRSHRRSRGFESLIAHTQNGLSPFIIDTPRFFTPPDLNSHPADLIDGSGRSSSWAYQQHKRFPYYPP